MKGSHSFHEGDSGIHLCCSLILGYPHGSDNFGHGHDPMWKDLHQSADDSVIDRMKHPDIERVLTKPTATLQSTTTSFQEEWKKELSFLSNYGYDLNSITPKTRIRVIHENSLNSIGGRSAPCVLYVIILYVLGM